ncbi:WD40 repeat domain-containing protein, partial [Candidatus Magnetominusculus xianensis]|uniref:WD40 repeat domain-containing protein n=1 Tax=Candidatus Magnetominusculus xianensis TaxID=1748249 RepID=UPI001F2DE74D
SCFITKDDKRLISGSYDNTLKLWDIDSGKEIATIELLWRVNDIKFSPLNPNVIITANANGTLTSFDIGGYLKI